MTTIHLASLAMLPAAVGAAAGIHRTASGQRGAERLGGLIMGAIMLAMLATPWAAEVIR